MLRGRHPVERAKSIVVDQSLDQVLEI